MANGLPYAVGAAFANPGRQIICLCGDGGFSMLMCELATIAKYNLPVKIIIFKNNSFGMIKWEQIAIEGRIKLRRFCVRRLACLGRQLLMPTLTLMKRLCPVISVQTKPGILLNL
jgi:hypothetical protein